MANGQSSMQLETIAQRLEAVEQEVAQLKQHLQPAAEKDRPWYLKHAGKFANDADFQEIVRLGREIRQADRPDEA